MSGISNERKVKLSYLGFRILMVAFLLSFIATGFVVVQFDAQPLHVNLTIPAVLFILIVLSYLSYNRPKMFAFLGEKKRKIAEIVYITSVILFFVLPFITGVASLSWKHVWFKWLVSFLVLILAFVVRTPATLKEEADYEDFLRGERTLPNDVPTDLHKNAYRR